MLKRIRLLMLLQLSNRFKFKKVDNVKKLIARIGIMALGIGIVTAVISLIFFLMYSIVGIQSPKVVTFSIVFLQLLSIVACINGLLKNLYSSKDNAILLSYPAHHFEVFISKLLVYYVYEFIKSIFFILPLLLGFGIIFKYFSVLYIVSTIFIVITIPLIPVLLGALITLPILFIKKFINKYSYLKSILLVSLLVGLFFLFFMILNLIPRPLRLIELYYSFIQGITRFIESIDKYSLFYQNVGNILVNHRVLLNYIIYIGVIILLIVSVGLISMPIYFKLASQSSELANEKKRKGINKAHKNTFFTFVKKEWLLSIRNFGEFLNNYIFTFATPYVLFIMMGIYTAIDLNNLGIYMTVIFSGFVTLLMSCASNTSSALAITKEGSEFVLLKTVPSDSKNMAWAKIFFNLVSSTIMIVLSFVLVIVFCPMFDPGINGLEWEWMINNNWLWLTMLSVLFINAGLIFWSFQIDIMNPKLREYASSGDASGMNNASKSILIGLIISVVFTIIALITLMSSTNMMLNWIIIVGIAFVFLLARLYMFVSYLKNVFPYIEY